MLKALTIRNFALVAELDVEFGAGLTVITGESGAGKSILLDALGLVLGARAKRAQIRPGADACDVTAEFDLGERPRSRAKLVELAMPSGDDAATCLVRRWAGEGRSRAFVNGVPATLAVLQSLTEPLIDIHGQHDHRQLLEPDMQRRLLDEFGVDPALVAATAAAYRERAALTRELAECRAAAERDRQRRSLLRYQLDELEALGDTVDRFAELTSRHKRLSRARELIETVGGTVAELEEDTISRVARLASVLDAADDPHPNLDAALELASSAQTHLEEALTELRRYLESLPEDDAELAEVDAALETIHDVARKHRVGAAELGAQLTRLEGELETLNAQEARVEDIAARSAEAEARFRAAGEALSEARREAAVPFADRVTTTLAELAFKGASLTVAFTPSESAAGLETVEFKVITNPRYPAGSLAEIASGGELSRISLAIEVVAAERSRLPCLILDEADVGVGGVAADVLGRLLRRLSRNTQVIAITHAPQIAALGDAHLEVRKTGAQDTVIRALDEAERTEELARMLGGRTITDDSRAYARTLLADSRDGDDLFEG